MILVPMEKEPQEDEPHLQSPGESQGELRPSPERGCGPDEPDPVTHPRVSEGPGTDPDTAPLDAFKNFPLREQLLRIAEAVGEDGKSDGPNPAGEREPRPQEGQP